MPAPRSTGQDATAAPQSDHALITDTPLPPCTGKASQQIPVVKDHLHSTPPNYDIHIHSFHPNHQFEVLVWSVACSSTHTKLVGKIFW
jgi:hypothetical protein